MSTKTNSSLRICTETFKISPKSQLQSLAELIYEAGNRGGSQPPRQCSPILLPAWCTHRADLGNQSVAAEMTVWFLRLGHQRRCHLRLELLSHSLWQNCCQAVMTLSSLRSPSWRGTETSCQ